MSRRAHLTAIMNGCRYLAPCSGNRVIFGEEANHMMACSSAEKCARFMQGDRPWHGRRMHMCQGDIDNFVDWESWRKEDELLD